MVSLRRRRITALALSAVMAMGLAACGDDEDEPAAQPTTTTGPQGSATVTIDMVDHAYQVSGPLIAGGTLRIANKGSEFHMIALGKFKAGKTLADLETALQEAGPPGGGGEGGGPSTTAAGGVTTTTARGATTTTARGATTTTARATTTSSPSTTAAGGAAGQGEEERQNPTAEILDEIGLPGNFMSPGESAEVTVPNLQPGSYALLCFIPTEGEGTPHFAKGMVGQLDVVAGQAPAPPTADATYRLAPGRAVEGPTTLTAGRHTLRFEAAAGSEQLEPTLARLNQGTTYEQLDAAFVTLFESEEPPAKGVTRTLPGQILFGGFDLEGVTSYFVTADFRPGNYVIVAEDTDEETPGPPKEIINIRVT